MNEPQDVSPSHAKDELASGGENVLRRMVLRLTRWIFGPPYFPSDLTWFLLALIATNSAVELLVEPPAYWIDPGISSDVTFLGTPLNWGLWSLAIYLVYMIIVGLAVSLISVKPAFLLWLTLSAFHLLEMTNSFRCGANYFPFENLSNCSEVHTGSLMVAGVLWGLGILGAASFDLIGWLPTMKSQDVGPRWTKSLRRASVAWTVLTGIVLTLVPLMPAKLVWRPLETMHAPSARTEAALAYDVRQGVALLFGGSTAWTESTGWNGNDETWTWDGSDWSQLHPVHSPSPRFAAGMAFDEKRGVAVLFGGSGQDSKHQTTFMDDSWEWDGQDWIEVSPAHSPPARQAPNIFFDPLRGTIVIYGGYYLDPTTQEKIFFDDAWEWDGERWSQLSFDVPRRTSSAAIVYDNARQFPLLMDGEGLWVWQNSDWIQANFFAMPPSRWNSRLAYDPKHEQVFLFGGFKGDVVFDDTWAFNGQTWKRVVTEVQPPPRNGHNLFYDQTRGNVLLFGGLNGLTFYNDMWEMVQR